MNKSLGSGAQGNVVLAKLNGEVVCLKMFGNSRVMNQELAMLEAAQKSGVVPSIKGAHSSPKGHILAMSYHGETTLEDFLASRPSPIQVHKIMLSLNDAVRALHDIGIIHNDLKENNILIESSPKKGRLVTVIDFGWSTYTGDVPYSHLNRNQMRFYPWIAPWLAEGGKATVDSDLYSVGYLFSTLSEKYPCPIYKVLAPFLTNVSTNDESKPTISVSLSVPLKMCVSLVDVRPMLSENSCSRCLIYQKPNPNISYVEQKSRSICRPIGLNNLHLQYRQPSSRPPYRFASIMNNFHWNESLSNASSLAYQNSNESSFTYQNSNASFLAYQNRGYSAKVHQPSFGKGFTRRPIISKMTGVPSNLVDTVPIHDFYSDSKVAATSSQEYPYRCSKLGNKLSIYPYD